MPLADAKRPANVLQVSFAALKSLNLISKSKKYISYFIRVISQGMLVIPSCELGYLASIQH